MAFTLYIAPRQSDKTRTSMSWLLGDVEGRAIVVLNEIERRRIIRDLAAATGTTSAKWQNHVIRWDDKYALQGNRHRELCIDNADLILQRMFSPHSLYAITMSIENIIEPDSARQSSQN